MSASTPPRIIAVTGSSGLVGRRLVNVLTSRGWEVRRVVRRNVRSEAGGERSGEGGDEGKGAALGNSPQISWDPALGRMDEDGLEGVEAVVHLAGENLAAGRWNAARKAAIRDSRVHGTALLCRTLAGLHTKPRVVVSASAVGIYGNTGEERVDESCPPGSGFLAQVCRDWEAATEPAGEAGMRVVNLRMGMVLAREGGALAKMLPPFRLGLGGPIGSGGQYMSWIAIADLIGVIQQALEDDTLSGPVNAVAPEAVPNREFARTLGRVLRRPALMPLPALAVGLLFGEMGRELLLQGQRVAPGMLTRAGFSFRHPTLEDALSSELGKG